MSAASDLFSSINNTLRGWGYPVEEQEGCWSRSNGSSWTQGVPIAHVNHHFVIPLSSPLENGISNVTYGDSSLSGPKCNWYGGIDPRTGAPRIRFISVGPANHAGQGRIEVRNRVAANLPPYGWVAVSYSPVADNWSGGNTSYAGTEWHHPGDSTPWPDALIDLVNAHNTAICRVAGWPADRCIEHAEHSARKIDRSYHTTSGGKDLRANVASRLNRQPEKPSSDWFQACFA